MIHCQMGFLHVTREGVSLAVCQPLKPSEASLGPLHLPKLNASDRLMVKYLVSILRAPVFNHPLTRSKTTALGGMKN